MHQLRLQTIVSSQKHCVHYITRHTLYAACYVRNHNNTTHERKHNTTREVFTIRTHKHTEICAPHGGVRNREKPKVLWRNASCVTITMVVGWLTVMIPDSRTNSTYVRTVLGGTRQSKRHDNNEREPNVSTEIANRNKYVTSTADDKSIFVLYVSLFGFSGCIRQRKHA